LPPLAFLFPLIESSSSSVLVVVLLFSLFEERLLSIWVEVVGPSASSESESALSNKFNFLATWIFPETISSVPSSRGDSSTLVISISPCLGIIFVADLLGVANKSSSSLSETAFLLVVSFSTSSLIVDGGGGVLGSRISPSNKVFAVWLKRARFLNSFVAFPAVALFELS